MAGDTKGIQVPAFKGIFLTEQVIFSCMTGICLKKDDRMQQKMKKSKDSSRRQRKRTGMDACLEMTERSSKKDK